MDIYEEYAESASKIFLDQIKSADQKAAYVLTVAIAFSVTLQDARSAFALRSYLDQGFLEIATRAGLSLSISIAFISALLTIIPRDRPGANLLYWKAWPAAGDRILQARRKGEADVLTSDLFESTRLLAAICSQKFRKLRISFLALLSGCVFYILLLANAGQ